jgi:hypothetical protein
MTSPLCAVRSALGPAIGATPGIQLCSHRRMSQDTFSVWLQTVPPHPSWTAYKLRSKGSLAFSECRAVFSPQSGDAVVIENVMKVTKGWKDSVNGTWLPPVVNTYIEVIYGDTASPSVAFLNDGRWLGLATFLPHRRLVRSLENLIAVT